MGVSYRFMHFRAILACLLTVILLSYPCAALACELRCGTASIRSGCHESGHLRMQKAPAMSSEMPNMQGSSLGRSASTAGEDVLFASTSCVRHLCLRQYVSLNKDSYRSIDRSISHQATPLRVFPRMPATSKELLSAKSAPHLRTPSPVLLHTALRV